MVGPTCIKRPVCVSLEVGLRLTLCVLLLVPVSRQYCVVSAGSTVELAGMTRTREPGYTPFADAPPLQDEEVPLPVSIPAEELQHLTGSNDTEVNKRRDAGASAFTSLVHFVWQGGSPGDAWLHMTAAQVAYTLLPSLPACSVALTCSLLLPEQAPAGQFYSWS